MELNNARIIITGGSTGIGFETARILKEAGANVLICARSEDTLKAAAAGLGIAHFTADVSDASQVAALFGHALSVLGGLDVLINNAGIGHIAPFVDTPVEDFTKIWEINTKSAFLCGQLAARHFIAQNSGNIINISSMGAVKGFANGSAYVASKAAMTGLTMCWQQELRKHNIRVTQINPSEVITPFGEKIGFVNSNPERKLHGKDIAQAILGVLRMDNVGFIPEVNVWATNPGS